MQSFENLLFFEYQITFHPKYNEDLSDKKQRRAKCKVQW